MNLPDVEIIEFVRPNRDDQCLYVTNIPAKYEETELHGLLHGIFSRYGLVYSIILKVSSFLQDKVSDTEGEDAIVRPKYYAFVTFFSALAAEKAKQGLVGRFFLKGQHVKIAYSRRKKRDDLEPLYITECYNLANHYLTYNSWSIAINKLQEEVDADVGDEEHDPSQGVMVYSAVVTLKIKDGNLMCTGVGIDKQTWDKKDQSTRSVALCRAKKRAYNAAVVDAFQHILLIVLANGRVHVEVNTTIEEQVLQEIDTKDTLTVNELETDPDDEADDIADLDDQTVDDLDLQNQQILNDLDMSEG